MMRRFVLAVAAVIVFVAGCADPELFSEIFQLRQGQKLYTRYNLWYTNPAEISCLNIQQGAFIPLGTEIIPVKTTITGDIVFRDVEGKEYTINFHEGHRLCSMREYIRQTFGTLDRDELLAGIPDEVQARILRGEVVPGMNQAQVLLAYGPPPAIRTPQLTNESWIYWIGESRTIRVIFRGDQVRSILNLDNE